MSLGKLIQVSGAKLDSNLVKATDFPAVGPSGPAGMSKGAGQLVKMTAEQVSPQDAAEFSVAQSPMEGAAVKCEWSVSLSDGQMSPNADKSY